MQTTFSVGLYAQVALLEQVMDCRAQIPVGVNRVVNPQARLSKQKVRVIVHEGSRR